MDKLWRDGLGEGTFCLSQAKNGKSSAHLWGFLLYFSAMSREDSCIEKEVCVAEGYRGATLPASSANVRCLLS